MPFRPANALPLLLAIEVNAYRIWLNPWGPGLDRPAFPAAVATARGRGDQDGHGMTSTTTVAIFISKASIFLPRYSGVRPTINPATKAARITKTSIS